MPGRTFRILLTCIAFLAGCAAGGPVDDAATPPVASRPDAAAESTGGSGPSTGEDADLLAGLSVVDKAGLVVMTALPGGPLDREAQHRLESARIGSVILFGYNVPSRQAARTLAGQLRKVASAHRAPGGMLVAIDQEGGFARNIDEAAPRKSAGELGRREPAATAQAYQQGARDLREWGIDLNLAPVADLDLAPHHVMRGRAFSADPDRAAAHVAAAVEGAHTGGGLVTLKHFPGLGRGAENTDDGPSNIEAGRAELDRSDLVPFAAGIDAGADAVMTTHAVVRAIDPTLPASLSPSVHRVLRGELGFDGVIITDSLNARGLRAQFEGTVPQACAAAIGAGADIALVTGTLETAMLCARAIRRALADGTLPSDRLDDAARRVLELRQRA